MVECGHDAVAAARVVASLPVVHFVDDRTEWSQFEFNERHSAEKAQVACVLCGWRTGIGVLNGGDTRTAVR